MRKKHLWGRKLTVMAGSTLLALALVIGSGAAAVTADETEEEQELYDEEEDDEDWDETDVEELEDWDEELSPEEEEFQEYIDANTASDLVELYDTVLYQQTMWNADGSETSLTGYIYEDADRVITKYVDDYEEIITKDRYDGYDPEMGYPVRYVFDSEDTREDMLMNYQEELFYLWGEEEIVGKTEAEGKITFTTEIRDSEMIGLILDDYDGDILEGDILSRDTTFDSNTMVLEKSLVKLISEDGSSRDIFACTIEVELEEEFPEDEELLSKLDAEDSHSLKLVLNPGTDDEQVIESTVGKGCIFYPILYDGYSYYTDEACTVAATEEDQFDPEKDIVLYGTFDEIYDEDMEIDGGDYELSFDDDDVDISELFETDEDEDIEG